MLVSETFFSLEVSDMERARTFYVSVFGASVPYASERWSSLIIAGVRVGLALREDHDGDRSGLHFAVDNLDGAREAVERAGGTAVGPKEVAPNLRFVEVTDTEGNTVILTQGRALAPA